ncbi:MAG: ACT domain-containing protein [Lachnospiraceae bacterium]|nr:ACT domain-containing protein [Lachnospiraceae bacterium]
MGQTEEYFIVRKQALPEVLQKVVDAKRLIDSGKVKSVNEAIKKVDISRSSFYKYKDDISPFQQNSRGKTLTIMLQLDDEPGLLSEVLKGIAKSNANVLTINQTIPIGGIASITISMQINEETKNPEIILSNLKKLSFVHYIKLLGSE